MLLLLQVFGEVVPSVPDFRRQLYDVEAKVEYMRLYGDVNVYQYYFIDAEVGTPAQRVSLILDTGSALIGFPCSNCKSCGRKHIDPNFDITKSETAQWSRCDNDCKTGCDGTRCKYSQSYAEGSSISGQWFWDKIHFGDSFQQNPAVWLRMGCHMVETNLFVTQKANGIIGIQSSSPSLKSLFADKKHVNTEEFAVCFAHQGGVFSVGGYNRSLHREFDKPLEWVKLEGSGFYAIIVSDFEVVGGGKIAGSFGRTIVDSGTTFSYFPSTVYHNFIRELQDYMDKNNIAKATKGCIRNDADISKLPPLKVTLKNGVNGSVDVLWQPEDYMTKEKGRSYSCPALDDNGRDPSTVLGASFMKHKNVVFDSVNRRIAFPAADCPTYVDRPIQQQPSDFGTRNDSLPPKPTYEPESETVELTWMHLAYGLVLCAIFFGIIVVLKFCIKTRRVVEPASSVSMVSNIGTAVPGDDEIFSAALGSSDLFGIDDSDLEDDEFQMEKV